MAVARDEAALARDDAAGARDDAAEARDAASAGAGAEAALQMAGDRALAAEDRVAATVDRVEAALRDVATSARDGAALARDDAAGARDVAAAGVGAGAAQQVAGDRRLAAGDRLAARHDRTEAGIDRHGAAHELQNAYRDDLTGALVRGAGRDQIVQALDRAHRTQEPLAVVFLDVDDLKRVNDEQGHAAGDHLLREVGSALRQGLRSYDVVVRYGGDEFVCALPGVRLAGAEQRFSEIRSLLADAIVGATVSVGIVDLQDAEGLDEVISRADAAMYESRRTRRDR